ncbi:glycosyltransferase family 4 protein [Brucella pseudogrignonensis]|uniref:glycosyltransferase family 4 protein n=1 Tax=Brucella pseudogrignonensis TaxID=419475 RepID=UPI00148DFB1F|nr:glycosyltransferase family 4 protein [Brucella pseudogrignonensis]
MREKASNEVVLFAFACDYAEVPHTLVKSVGEIILHPHFQSSDLIVFHFGVYHELFNAIFSANKMSKKYVIFHNITPKAYLPPSAHQIIDRSIAQMHNMRFADKIICCSKVNQGVLRSAGINTDNTVVPLSIDIPDYPPSTKPSFHDNIIRIAFVGRFVQSKGIDDLIKSLNNIVSGNIELVLQVDLIGNLKFSDEIVFDRLKANIEKIHSKAKDKILFNIHGNASNDAKHKILAEADIFVLPTYHEGFCVPILEAISAGCLVVSYDNSNVPEVCGGLGSLVATGNTVLLTEAISSLLLKVSSPDWRSGDGGYSRYVRDAISHISHYSPNSIRRDLLKALELYGRRTKLDIKC